MASVRSAAAENNLKLPKGEGLGAGKGPGAGTTRANEPGDTPGGIKAFASLGKGTEKPPASDTNRVSNRAGSARGGSAPPTAKTPLQEGVADSKVASVGGSWANAKASAREKMAR